VSAAAGGKVVGPHSTKRARRTSAETGQSLSRRTAGGGNRGAVHSLPCSASIPKGKAMRAIRRLCLAPIILATVATITAGPTHQGGHVTQSASQIAAYYCPAGSNWDNILMHCD
jgi:hypothetical protein